MKVNEIKIKKGVDLAQHLVDFYDAQVTWVLSIIVFPLSKKTQTSEKIGIAYYSCQWLILYRGTTAEEVSFEWLH